MTSPEWIADAAARRPGGPRRARGCALLLLPLLVAAAGASALHASSPGRDGGGRLLFPFVHGAAGARGPTTA